LNGPPSIKILKCFQELGYASFKFEIRGLAARKIINTILGQILMLQRLSEIVAQISKFM